MPSIDDIRTILVNEWDPLDIGLNVNLHDEYDGVATDIFQAIGRIDFRSMVKSILITKEIDFEISPINEVRIDHVSDLLAKISS